MTEEEEDLRITTMLDSIGNSLTESNNTRINELYDFASEFTNLLSTLVDQVNKLKVENHLLKERVEKLENWKEI